MLLYLIGLFIWGLIIGALARLALPGPDPMGIFMTAAVGVAGSFIGGLVMYAITGGRNGGGFLVAFVFTVLLVYVIRRTRGGGVMSPDGSAASRRRGRGYR
ncbi:MAG: hypothetical protein QOE28_3034 [Solirubrobacteraceae bacterium]|jgi:uncharacterized membrane protein YeaQ/YmgE (transglycosylase-associated protein family)|nr:hypothetical protein [Solirubrobacteraceae bacterium]